MTGQFNFNKFVIFLKSFWGLLASFTVILPTIIYFSNAKQIKESILSQYYIGIPTTFALLTIPFVFLYEDKLGNLNFARRQSLTLAILALSLIFSFVITKNNFVYDKVYPIVHNGNYTITQIQHNSKGLISSRTYKPTKIDPAPTDFQIIDTEEIKVNPYEILSMILYSFGIILLTAAFATLGVFFYTKTS